jgi:thiol-disulfide isomerase/thioredoxin
MKRRRQALVLGAAAAGGLAGWAWHSHRQPATLRGDAAPRAGAAPPLAAGDPAVAEFWQQGGDRPDGRRLDFADLRGRRLLVNFWATWCPPCVKEMPLLEQFHREHGPDRRPGPDGWRVLGVAIDRTQSVVEFLRARPVSYDIVVAGLDGTTWGRALGNDKGGLPFTVAIDAAGRISHRKIGEIDANELRRWARG